MFSCWWCLIYGLQSRFLATKNFQVWYVSRRGIPICSLKLLYLVLASKIWISMAHSGLVLNFFTTNKSRFLAPKSNVSLVPKRMVKNCSQSNLKPTWFPKMNIVVFLLLPFWFLFTNTRSWLGTSLPLVIQKTSQMESISWRKHVAILGTSKKTIKLKIHK